MHLHPTYAKLGLYIQIDVAMCVCVCVHGVRVVSSIPTWALLL